MKLNYALVSRCLIALLFVVAGVNKIMGFQNMVGYFGSLGIPLPALATIIVILIEIPVALMFAYGYKVKETGYTLIAFTLLTILIGHRNIFGADMVMALKNLAIMGGILAAIGCSCLDCAVHNKRHPHHGHNHNH